MATLSEITDFLDAELRIAEIPDYPGALNGLQLENRGEVTKVAAAVDASLPVVRKAVEAGADLLVVHHGMFWQGVRPLTGAFFEKIRIAMDAGLAIYSSHLPLDVHPTFGNNALLAERLDIGGWQAFLPWKGLPVGLRSEVEMGLDELIARAEKALGGAVHVCRGGSERVRRVGLVTGGAGSQVEEVAAAGVDVFITGEGPHWSFPLAEELGLNVIHGGHYRTETFGVRAIADELGRRFSVETEFVDHPTGL